MAQEGSVPPPEDHLRGHIQLWRAVNPVTMTCPTGICVKRVAPLRDTSAQQTQGGQQANSHSSKQTLTPLPVSAFSG